MTCDGRLLHRQAAVTGNTLSPTVNRRVRRTSTDVDEAERSRLAEILVLYKSIINKERLSLLFFYYYYC